MSFRAIIVLASSFLLGPDMAAKEITLVPPEVRASPCQDLKPFNNLDELLYQFYINLDRDCLFEMPVEELEKIWGIKIMDTEREPDIPSYELRKRRDFYVKPYESAKDAFYVERMPDRNGKNVFIIHITSQYRDKYYTLFPNNDFPKLLPKPETYFSPNLGHDSRAMQRWLDSEAKKAPQDRKPGPDMCRYNWYSSDRTRRIYFTNSYGTTDIRVSVER